MQNPVFPLLVWPVTIAAGITAATFFHFAGYSHERRWAISLGEVAVLLLTLSLPFLAAALLIRPGPRMAWISSFATGMLVSASTIYGLTARPKLGGFVADLAVLFHGLLMQVVWLELLCLPLLFVWPRLRPYAQQFVYVAGMIVAVILCGWAAGVALWSKTVPPRVITAAERAASGRPYCLMTGSKIVRSRNELTGIAMLPTYQQGMSFDFHAVMVLAEPAGFKNWSYASGSFQDFKAASFPDITRPDRLCKPTRHFAVAL